MANEGKYTIISEDFSKYWFNITRMYNNQRFKGVKKYGLTLEENTPGIGRRITHLQEEMIDALMYCEWIKECFVDNAFNTYQNLAMRTSKKATVKESVTQACIGMAGEVGEFCNLWEKYYSQGHLFCDIEEKLKLELGDILWYLTLACEGLGVSLGDVAKNNIEKLEARYKNSDGTVDFTPEKSEERRDENGE